MDGSRSWKTTRDRGRYLPSVLSFPFSSLLARLSSPRRSKKLTCTRSLAFSRDTMMQSKLGGQPAFVLSLRARARARACACFIRVAAAIRGLDACRRLINGWTETKQVEPVGVPCARAPRRSLYSMRAAQRVRARVSAARPLFRAIWRP